MTTTYIEVLDTAVKVGLGALIGGVTTILTNRRAQRHEISKLRIQETTQLLRECISKLESASTQINDSLIELYAIWKKHSSDNDSTLQDCHRRITAAFNGAKDAYSITVMLCSPEVVQLASDYCSEINSFGRHFKLPLEQWNESWLEGSGKRRSELKRKILENLAEAHSAAYA